MLTFLVILPYVHTIAVKIGQTFLPWGGVYWELAVKVCEITISWRKGGELVPSTIYDLYVAMHTHIQSKPGSIFPQLCECWINPNQSAILFWSSIKPDMLKISL